MHISEQPRIWRLYAVRKSTPGDPTGPVGPSRFIVTSGTMEEMSELYNNYHQPTEIILAELIDHTGLVVKRFDHVAEVLDHRASTPYDWDVVGRVVLAID